MDSEPNEVLSSDNLELKNSPPTVMNRNKTF